MVDIFKGKILYFIINIVPQIFGISGSGNCCKVSGLYTEKQGHHCHNYKDKSSLDNISEISFCNANINNFAISRGINTSISTSNVTKRGVMMDCFCIPGRIVKVSYSFFYIPPYVLIRYRASGRALFTGQNISFGNICRKLCFRLPYVCKDARTECFRFLCRNDAFQTGIFFFAFPHNKTIFSRSCSIPVAVDLRI